MQVIYLITNSVSIYDENVVKAYQNSACGRAQLEAECPSEIVQEVYKVWGDTPTVTEPELLPVPAPQPSNQEKLNASLMIEIAKLKAGA